MFDLGDFWDLFGVDTDDGIPDLEAVQPFQDGNGGGIPDLVLIDPIDSGGDEAADWVQAAEDFHNDGWIESLQDPFDPEALHPWEDGDGSIVLTGKVYETFDPDSADMDCIVGEPGEAIEHWHRQETSSSCAVAAQEFVLEQLTGQVFDESDLRELAEEQGWYAPEGGTPMSAVGNILELMGLHVERSVGNSIQDLKECLEKGGTAIVGVDSGEILEGQDDDFFGPGMDADHAVQVIGLDYSDPDDPKVILNDPGVGNGKGAMLSLDVFLGAWEDSGCFMAEAYT